MRFTTPLLVDAVYYLHHKYDILFKTTNTDLACLIYYQKYGIFSTIHNFNTDLTQSPFYLICFPKKDSTFINTDLHCNSYYHKTNKQNVIFQVSDTILLNCTTQIFTFKQEYLRKLANNLYRHVLPS